jgi:hypothetical protein
MTREEFEQRFREALTRAAADTSAQTGLHVAVPDRAILLCLPPDRRNVTIEEAIEWLFLGPDRSYVFIDIGIRVGGPDKGVAWIRPSGHNPRPHAEVWDADGIGPFKSVAGIGTLLEWDEARGIPGADR